MLISIVASCCKLWAPLWIATLAALCSEWAGIPQVGLEGQMLLGSLVAASSTYLLHPYFGAFSVWFGFFFAGLFGALLICIQGIWSISRNLSSIVTGTACNILVFGICPLATKVLFGSTGSTPNLDLEDRWSLSPIFISVILSGVIFFLLHRSIFGLRVKTCGYNKKVLQGSGVNPARVQWQALLLCGVLSAGSGAFFSTGLSSCYTPNMIGGRGYIALAALICGNWTFLGSLGYSLFFAALEILPAYVNFSGINATLMQSLPFVLTLLILGISQRLKLRRSVRSFSS